jgi:hypothetical protein
MPTILEKLPPRTREIHSRLVRLTADSDGLLVASMIELAALFKTSRQTLHTHITRLRRAGLLQDLESIAADESWRRVRRVISPLQTPLTNSHLLIDEGMHAKPSEGLRPSFGFAGRRVAASKEEPMTDHDELAALLAGVGPARPFDARLLPPYPGIDTIQPVTSPKMPRLSGDLAGDGRLLIKAYKAACSHRYGRKPRVDKRAAFRMQAAVLALRKNEIVSPYAWAGFRLTQWQYSERRSKPPKIDYVFSAKVIDEQIGMYRRKAESYDVLHRVMLTPSHAELLERWERCRRAVASPNSGEIGEEETVRIVTSILPPSTYHDLAERVPGERAAMSADLFRRLAAGEWIW